LPPVHEDAARRRALRRRSVGLPVAEPDAPARERRRGGQQITCNGSRAGCPTSGYFETFSTNASSAAVAGSSDLPRSALIFVWVVSLPPKSVTGTPASFSTLPRRRAWALVSGWPATYRMKNGGMP